MTARSNVDRQEIAKFEALAAKDSERCPAPLATSTLAGRAFRRAMACGSPR